MSAKNPVGAHAAGFFLYSLLAVATAAIASPLSAAASPFSTRDQNPFSLVYGQPLPSAARLPRPSDPGFSISLDIANTLNAETTATEALYADFESYNLTLGGIEALNQHWAVKLDVPFIYRSGGYFDRTIDEWHQIFGLPRAYRPLVADNEFQIFYARNEATAIYLDSSTAGIADSQLSIARALYQDANNAVSAWGAVDIPLGDSNELTGNDDLDFSLWLAGSTRLLEFITLDSNIGAVLPGDSVIAGLATEDLVGFGHIGMHLTLNPTIALKLQLSGHSGYYQDTSLEFLGSATIIVFGGSINLGRCSALDIGFTEDIDVGASPDASLLISWKSRVGC